MNGMRHIKVTVEIELRVNAERTDDELREQLPLVFFEEVQPIIGRPADVKVLTIEDSKKALELG